MNTTSLPRRIGWGEKIKVFYDDLVEDLGDICDDMAIYIEDVWIATKKFLYISSMIPMKIAKYFTFTSGRYPIDQIFKSQERFTVCLSSDWRNYQQFSNKMDDSQLSGLIEKFYDIIFEKLEEYVPDGQYYADWTADELFVVFYDDENNEKEFD